MLIDDNQYPVLTKLINDTQDLYNKSLGLSKDNANAEMVLARKGEIDLPTKIDKMDSATNDNTTEIVNARDGEIDLPTKIGKIDNNISSHDSQLSDISINIKLLNVIPNDNTKATSNAIAINNFFSTNTNKTLLCTNDNFYIDDTIIVTGTNKLIGQQSTKFILTTTNKDAFRLKPFASIEKITIELPANHNMAGIKVGNNDDFTQWNNHYLTYVRDIFIYGNVSELSTGIWCEASNGYNVSNFTANNVTIMNCYYGIYVITSGNGWANGNNFINVYPQNCKYGIYNKGNANKFIYSVQVGNTSVTNSGIFTGGSENIFIGKVWDVVSGQYLIETDYNSQNNTFEGQSFTPNIMQNFIKNRGTNNIFVGDSVNKNYSSPKSAYRYSADDNSSVVSPTWANHFGVVDDLLSFIDKTATINLSNGDGGILSGSMSTLFSNQGIIYNNTSSSNPITIEIILPTALNFITEMGITFQGGMNPQNVKIETASSSGGGYTTALNITDNKKEIITYNPSAYGTTIGKIKISLSAGIVNNNVNPNGRISIWNLFMFGNGYNGSFYLPRSGGNVYGNLLMNNNYMQIGNVAALPTASASYRGMIITVQGGTGVADKSYICLKSATDTYSWVQTSIG